MLNIVSRVITSLILLPLVVTLLVLGGSYLGLLLAIVSLLACFEAATMIDPRGQISKIAAVLFWFGIFLPALFDQPWLFLICVVPAVIVFNGVVLFTSSISQSKFEKLCTSFYWSFYINFALACVYWTTNSTSWGNSTGLSLIFIMCIATWSNDTFAYFGGRLFGKHPLFKSVSAKKTWEGFIIGGAMSIVTVFAIKYIPTLFNVDWLPTASLSDLLWIALPAVFLAPFGDLAESRFKRFYDAKDSSGLLPGHGGLLDRIDGILMLAPWTALYAFIIRPLC